MTSLAQVLASKAPAAVYDWDTALTPVEVAESVAVAGWHLAVVDGWTAPDKSGLLAALATALDFPSYFGGNLDAVVDCLRSLGANSVPVVLVWEGPQALEDSDPAAYAALLDILSSRARVSEPAPFAVFLRR